MNRSFKLGMALMMAAPVAAPAASTAHANNLAVVCTTNPGFTWTDKGGGAVTSATASGTWSEGSIDTCDTLSVTVGFPPGVGLTPSVTSHNAIGTFMAPGGFGIACLAATMAGTTSVATGTLTGVVIGLTVVLLTNAGNYVELDVQPPPPIPCINPITTQAGVGVMVLG